MSTQFNIGDIVRLNNTQQEAEVIGFDEGSADPLLRVQLAGSQGKVYFPVKSVTLVRSGGTAQGNHPSKIVT
jgi:hypothetical protein